MGSGRTGILNLELRFRVLSSTSRAEAQTMQSYQKDQGMDREFGKRLYLKWINNKVLLYSTGTCVQSLGIEHGGG